MLGTALGENLRGEHSLVESSTYTDQLWPLLSGLSQRRGGQGGGVLAESRELTSFEHLLYTGHC